MVVSPSRVHDFHVRNLRGSPAATGHLRIVGDNMKSDLSAVDTSKEAVAQPQRVRRMSKPTSAMNGDATDADSDCCTTREVNMVAAIQDHISCTKSSEILRSQELREEKAALPCELDHMYANCGAQKAVQDDSQQVKQLRELLLLHLDLIQQQDEQLRSKDRQITALKQEKEALKQRLDRMERRMALLKQKGRASSDFVESTNSVSSDSQEKIENLSSPSNLQKDKNKSLLDKRLKRKISTDSLIHTKRKNSTIINSAESSEVKDHINSEIKNSECSPKEKDDKSDVTKKDIFRTDIMYFSNYGSPVRSPDSPARDEEVIVPSWRIHQVTSCYQLEGTENLDDEVFLKRHQKLEIDERRRKRWDIQRIREQRLNEKLKRGRSGNEDDNTSEDPDIPSFYPNPEDAQFLEVSDTVPVCAFGFPVPNFQPCEFSLPWYIVNTDKKDKIEKQKNISPNVKKHRTSDGKHGS